MKPRATNPTLMRRRAFLKAAGSALVCATGRAPAVAKPIRVKAGYVHVVAVDGQLWLADFLGAWAAQGLSMEFVKFQDGLEAFQAMMGGSIDILATGAVVSNFPARGRGKVFLINDIEFATAQLWCHCDMGIETIADLRGKKILTTVGTTPHIFLDTALRESGLGPKDVLIIDQRMPSAVAAFVANAAPAIALWVPYNLQVKREAPTARMLVNASAFYPKAAILGGWAARNGFFEANQDVLTRVITAWSVANDFLVTKPQEALATLHEKYYPHMALPDVQEQLAAQKTFSSSAWRNLYIDGTVTRWLQQVSDFFVTHAAIKDPVPASKYFDPSLYLKAIS
jgi:NitT/TauT family transport system substrate-binding protein